MSVKPLPMATLPPVLPPPARLPIDKLPATLRLAPVVLSSETAPVPRALLLVVVSVPALIVVPPL